MKLFFFLCFSTIAFSVSASDTTSLIGKWGANPNKGAAYIFEFRTDSTMTIVVGTDTTHAKYNLSYDSAAPVPGMIDMHIIDRVSGEVIYTNKGIYEKAGATRVRLRWSENMDTRPKNFMPHGNLDTLTLNRLKQ